MYGRGLWNLPLLVGENYVLLCSLADGGGVVLLIFVPGVLVVQHGLERERIVNYLFEGPACTRDAGIGFAVCKGGEEQNCLR